MRIWFTNWGPKTGGCFHAHEDPGEAQECLDRQVVLTGVIDRRMRVITTPREARVFSVDTGPGRRPFVHEVD